MTLAPVAKFIKLLSAYNNDDNETISYDQAVIELERYIGVLPKVLTQVMLLGE
jgi:hypothetical protein